MGPAVATQILLNSSLKNHFDVLHLDTRINTSLKTMGKWGVGKILKNIGNYFRLLKINVTRQPALVLIPVSQTTTGYLKDFVYIFLCKLTGRKIVLQLRGSNFKNWLDQASVMTRSLVKLSMKWSEGVIVLGNSLKYLFTDYFPEERIFVIPNGGNFRFPPAREHNGAVRFLFLSNLFDAKGIRDVVDAVTILKRKESLVFHLDVAGSWLEEKTKDYCLRQVAEHLLPVTFIPPVAGDEKLKRFTEADVFIFTPREPEGHPWVIVEAMAAALPILATDKGAITESVIDGENGYIVKANSPADIAEKMELMGRDVKQMKSMGHRSLEFYESKFTEEKMVENYVRCFNVLIGKEVNG
jgi:glycosyltransferase involved in cell wall biosynthesis